jgi:cyclic dehypoxanthinyl futalosine synthase
VASATRHRLAARFGDSRLVSLPAGGRLRGALLYRRPAGRRARLDDAAALELLRHGDLLELGRLADAERRRHWPGDEVTFIVDRNINYTNYCISGCRFCAFYKRPGSGEGYLLSSDEIYTKIEETLALGGTAVMMQGGLHPGLGIDYYEDLFRGIRERYHIHIHSLSPPEVAHIASVSGLDLTETLRRLRDAGLDSLPGGGAEVLADRVRLEISPHKISTAVWLDVMRRAHSIGLPTTATMMFGSIDTPAERIEHLRRIRDLQDETGGFIAFIPWTFQAGNTDLQAGHVPATGIDYLRLLAVSRAYLDNVPAVQASWVTQGLKLGQVALAFGASDMGSTMIEENVVRATGVGHQVNIEQMINAIRAAGRTPVQRDTLYREVRRY